MRGTEEWRPLCWVAWMTIVMAGLGSWGFVHEMLGAGRPAPLMSSLVLIGLAAYGVRLLRVLALLSGRSQDSSLR